jgi:NTP pyrophosphatase (non-canonical NTP hydrolase)
MQTFNDYRLQAARALNSNLDPQLQLEVYAMGLAGESGELCSLIANTCFDSKHSLDSKTLIQQLGKVLRCVAAIATTLELKSCLDYEFFNKALGSQFSSGKLHKFLMLDNLVGQVFIRLIDYDPSQGRKEKLAELLWRVLDCLNAIAQCYHLTLLDVAQTNLKNVTPIVLILKDQGIKMPEINLSAIYELNVIASDSNKLVQITREQFDAILFLVVGDHKYRKLYNPTAVYVGRDLFATQGVLSGYFVKPKHLLELLDTYFVIDRND